MGDDGKIDLEGAADDKIIIINFRGQGRMCRQVKLLQSTYDPDNHVIKGTYSDYLGCHGEVEMVVKMLISPPGKPWEGPAMEDSYEQDMTTVSRHFIQRKDVTEDNPVPYMEKSAPVLLPQIDPRDPRSQWKDVPKKAFDPTEVT